MRPSFVVLTEGTMPGRKREQDATYLRGPPARTADDGGHDAHPAGRTGRSSGAGCDRRGGRGTRCAALGGRAAKRRPRHG